MLVVNDLHREIKGNGQPGLKQKAESFMSEYAGMRAQQQRQHDSNSRKLNALLVIGGLMTALIAILDFIHR
jgi:hypothetical protein